MRSAGRQGGRETIRAGKSECGFGGGRERRAGEGGEDREEEEEEKKASQQEYVLARL